jgi:hypothetical protein
MGIFILFYTTACSSIKSTTKLSLAKPTGNGGNPEVLNHCFGLKKTAKKLCFNHFFPNNTNLLIHPTQGEAIMLAGRGTHIEKRELQLNKDDDKVLLYLDISNIKVPLSSNIETTTFTYNKNNVVVNIDTNEIKEKIILKDKEGNVVLEYRVKR